MQKVKAKKFLGQHFLKDLTIAERIVKSLSSYSTGHILEIGPGMGVLTQFIVQNKNLKVVELDRESVAYLKNSYPQLASNIIEGDFLKMNITTFFNEPFSILGNFPYNISSQIFFKVLENKHMVTEIVCMLQREVARRIASGPGNKEYGILSVLLQAYYDIEYLFTVNEGVFDPPPKVKSGVIRLVRNSINELTCSDEVFLKVVKTAFNQRRKTLRNSLKTLYISQNSEFLNHEIINLRPEQLTVNDFVFLASNLSKA